MIRHKRRIGPKGEKPSIVVAKFSNGLQGVPIRYRYLAATTLALVIVGLATIVPVAIYRSLASTSTAALEGENGTLSSLVTVGNDSNASGGAYIQFGAPVGAFDFAITGISASPASPTAGQAVTFSAVVKNQGSGSSPSGTIVGVSFTVDGTQVSWSDTYTSSIGPGQSVTLTANSGPSASSTWSSTAGTHTIQAWVDDVNRFPNETNETNNKTTFSLTVSGSAPTSSSCSGTGSGKVGNTRGGLVGFANGYRYGQLSASDRDKYLGIYTDVGAKWYRMNMEYWNMPEYVELVSKTKALGICLIGNISSNKSGTAAAWTDPPDHQAWANAAAAEVSQLKNDVHVWEIWNEQNIGFWKPSPNAGAYADLLHRTYLAIKAVDPTAIVLGGGLAPQGGGTDANNSVNYWKRVYDWNKSQGRQGSSQLFDGLAHHPYYYPGDPTSAAKLQDWSGFYQTYLIHQNVMCNASYGGPTNDCAKKIWGTEGGFPTECSDPAYCQSLSTAAGYVPKMMDMWMNTWGSFTGPFMWYQPQNQPGQSGHELYMGWVRGDWTRKDPMFSALRTYDARTN